MKRIVFAITVALSVLLFASCEKDSQAPVPPSAETFAPELASFRTSAETTKANTEKIDEFFTYASTQVVANWITIFEKIIDLPIEAYRKVIISSEPVESGKGWTWTAQYTDDLGQVYTVVLYGEDKGKKTNWEVRVTKDGILGYENFAWITGWSAKNGKSGQWDVKVSPQDTDVLVTIDWSARNEKVETVKVTYQLDHLCMGIRPFFHESYMIYKASATDDTFNNSLSAYYNHLGLGYWKVDIEWNEDTGAGRVNCKSKFGDGEWHYWNSTHEDVVK